MFVVFLSNLLTYTSGVIIRILAQFDDFVSYLKTILEYLCAVG